MIQIKRCSKNNDVHKDFKSQTGPFVITYHLRVEYGNQKRPVMRTQQQGNRGYFWYVNVLCYVTLCVTRQGHVLIKEALCCSSLGHRSYLINNGLCAWPVIYYWLFGERGRLYLQRQHRALRNQVFSTELHQG